MATDTFRLGWSDEYGEVLAYTKELADTGRLKLDVIVDTGIYSQQIAASIVASKTNGVFIASNADCTLYVNGTNEVVTVTPASASPGDTFRLIFGGNTTAPITFTTATGATVQAALEALASIGVGNVSVTGPAGGPWVVTFVKALGLTNVGAITVGTISTVSSATITPTVTTSGAAAAQTITLLAGIPLQWFTGCGLAYPISADVVNFYCTNISGQQITLRIRQLYHP